MRVDVSFVFASHEEGSSNDRAVNSENRFMKVSFFLFHSEMSPSPLFTLWSVSSVCHLYQDVHVKDKDVLSWLDLLLHD